MRIKSIHIYSHDGRRRDLNFTAGLNVITGRSSTGKSALSEIVEYCMGNSDFKVPEGVIRDKVAWFAVIYQFDSEEVLVAKATPMGGAQSSSAAMTRRGTTVSAPPFDGLDANTDDEAVSTLLSRLLGIPENRTDVPLENSRASYTAQIKHTLFYLFQKQGLIANKDQLFYRQNEPYIPQSIKDTLPILLGFDSAERYTLEARLRAARRELVLSQKRLDSYREASKGSYITAVALYSEATAAGILEEKNSPQDITALLRTVEDWTPQEAPIVGDAGSRTSELENEIRGLRQERRELQFKLDAARKYSSKAGSFENEAGEQRDRLASIHAFPKDPKTGVWQWPFAEANLGMTEPIADVLLAELRSLDDEMEAVLGERPKLETFLAEISDQVQQVVQLIHQSEAELAAVLAINDQITGLRDRAIAAARVVGRVSLYLENLVPDSQIADAEDINRKNKSRVDRLVRAIGSDDRN